MQGALARSQQNEYKQLDVDGLMTELQEHQQVSSLGFPLHLICLDVLVLLHQCIRSSTLQSAIPLQHEFRNANQPAAPLQCPATCKEWKCFCILFPIVHPFLSECRRLHKAVPGSSRHGIRSSWRPSIIAFSASTATFWRYGVGVLPLQALGIGRVCQMPHGLQQGSSFLASEYSRAAALKLKDVCTCRTSQSTASRKAPGHGCTMLQVSAVSSLQSSVHIWLSACYTPCLPKRIEQSGI